MRQGLALLVAATFLAGCTLPWDRVIDGGPGDAAKDLVSGSQYANLLVEIDHPSGAGPNAKAVEHLKSTLREVTGKTTITVELDASIPSSTKKYSFDEIADLERENRDRRSSGDTSVLYVVYVAGGSEEDTSEGVILGATYSGTSIVMFKGNLRANSGGGALSGKPSEDVIESAVLVHEFGHAAGLVNLGAEMVRNHEDPQNKGHSSNPESVMYWAVENTAGLVGILKCGLDPTCGIPLAFDADDKADLKRLREG